jgi:NADPH2:quinone reductase
MKAARFHETGGADVLVYEDVSDPTPLPLDGEVLIRVEAVGLNFADVVRRRGDDDPEPSYPPFILGAEVAGTIAAVGPEETALEVGAPVLATAGAGRYAQHICVPAATVIPLPAGVTAVQAPAFAVQLAKLYGASNVIAAASTPEKRAIAERLGADASVDGAYFTRRGHANASAICAGPHGGRRGSKQPEARRATAASSGARQ